MVNSFSSWLRPITINTLNVKSHCDHFNYILVNLTLKCKLIFDLGSRMEKQCTWKASIDILWWWWCQSHVGVLGLGLGPTFDNNCPFLFLSSPPFHFSLFSSSWTTLKLFFFLFFFFSFYLGSKKDCSLDHNEIRLRIQCKSKYMFYEFVVLKSEL